MRARVMPMRFPAASSSVLSGTQTPTPRVKGLTQEQVMAVACVSGPPVTSILQTVSAAIAAQPVPHSVIAALSQHDPSISKYDAEVARETDNVLFVRALYEYLSAHPGSTLPVTEGKHSGVWSVDEVGFCDRFSIQLLVTVASR